MNYQGVPDRVVMCPVCTIGRLLCERGMGSGGNNTYDIQPKCFICKETATSMWCCEENCREQIYCGICLAADYNYIRNKKFGNYFRYNPQEEIIINWDRIKVIYRKVSRKLGNNENQDD